MPSIYPPGVTPPVIELKVEVITPPKLFVSIGKLNSAPLKNYQSGKSAIPSFSIAHRVYRGGEGGLGPMGFDWETGPAYDQSCDVNIFSVNSLEIAKLLRENEPYARYGIFYDFKYFEWCIQIPLRKASPRHKDSLIKLLNEAGVKVD